MRVFWIVLLIALLPLRGWVGDAMALGMATSAPVQTASVAAAGDDCPHHASEAHADHSGHTMAERGAPGHGEHGSSQNHLLCDLCNGPVLSPASAGARALAIEQGPPVEHAQRFASLAPRRVVKPPIA